MEAWQHPDIFKLEDVEKLKDGIISDILVMICNQCGSEARYTLKEIEKEFRKQLSGRILTMMSRGDIPDPGTLKKTNRIYFYCGKCTGYDGKGSCPKYVYDNCVIKRMPYGF